MGTKGDYICLVIYSVLWIITICKYKRIQGRWTLGYMILLLYTFMSLVSIHCYSSPYASLKFEPDLTIFPFLYLYGMIVLSAYPLLQLKEKELTHIILPSYRLLNIIAISCIVLSILHVVSILPDLKSGIIMMFADSDNAIDLYNDATSAKFGSAASTQDGINIVSILSGQSLVFLPLVFYLYLIIPRKNKLILTLLTLCLLILPLEGVSKANRQMMVLSILEVLFLFFFFKDFISNSLRKKFRFFLVGILAFFGVIFISITLVRTSMTSEDMDYVIFGVERYFAEGPIVFNDCIDANGTREGNRVFPLLKMAIGEPVLSASEMRSKYSMMTVDSSRFSTYVGDFVLDYGPISTFIIFSLFSLVCSRVLRHKRILKIQNILLIYLIMKLCTGFYQCTLIGVANNISVVLIIMLYVFFSYMYHSSKKIVIIKEEL